MLSFYQNRAVRDLILAEFKLLGPKVGDELPEYIKTSIPIAVVSGAVPRPSDCWLVADVYIPASKVKFFPIPPEEVVNVITGRNPLIVPTAKSFGFYQEGTDVKFLAPTATIPDVVLRYLITPDDLVHDGAADLPLNSNWWGNIVDRMIALGEADAVRIVGAK